MLLHAGHVGESDINEDYFFVLDKVENFLGLVNMRTAPCSTDGAGGYLPSPHSAFGLVLAAGKTL